MITFLRGLRRVATAVLAGGAIVGLAGCITLLPKVKPVQLYRFGTQTQPLVPAPPKSKIKAQTQAAVAPSGFLPVLRGATTFSRVSAGDRILSVTGQQTAYLADARWSSNASVLFDEAMVNAFSQGVGDARLVRSAEAASARAALRLDVRAFEVRYGSGLGRKLTAVISVQGLLVEVNDGEIIAQQLFDCAETADSNRVHAIVAALNDVVNDCQGQIVVWTNDTLKAKPPH